MLDIIIKNGAVHLGDGSPGQETDLGIKNGKIAALGNLEDKGSRETIDARGMFVTPGFIDTHCHSDLSILEEPSAWSAVSQGITTQIVGNCGLGVVPAPECIHRDIKEMTLETLQNCTVSIGWEDLEGYFSAVERKSPRINVGVFVPHSTLRIAVMGYEKRPAEEKEIREMERLLDRQLSQGALGMSTGLTYIPASYAGKDELEALCRVIKKHDAVMVTHVRYPFVSPEGAIFTLEKAVDEVLELPRKTGVKLHISHHQSIGSRDWGEMDGTLQTIDRLSREGLNITLDLYPYTAGSTTLTILIPDYLLSGGPAKLYRLIRDPHKRGEIEKGIYDTQAAMYPEGLDQSWYTIYITSADRDIEGIKLAGKSIGEIADFLGTRPESAVVEIFRAQGKELDFSSVYMARFTMQESEVEKAISHPLSMIGSDGRAMDRDGIYRDLMVHPRYFGTFPRYFSRYVREAGLMSWEEGIRKVTSLPAQTFRIPERGLLQEGYFADVVIFDPEKITDRATFDNPLRYSEGIECVIVNGEVVYRSGSHVSLSSEKTAGRGLARKP